MNNLLPLALEQVDALDLWFTKVLPVIFGLAIHLPILLIISAGTDPMTGLLMLITLPIAPFLLYLIGRVSRDASKKEWQKLTELSAGFAELLHTLPTVKLFRQERRLTETVASLSENFAQSALLVLQITFISAFALELITTLSIAIVAVSIGLRLLYGQLTFFTAFFVLLVLPEFYQPLRQAGTAFHGGMTAYTAETSLAEFLHSREVKAEVNLSNDLTQEMGVIIGQHISFGYGAGSLPILQDKSFVVPAQQITVIRGSSGSGKTTLLRLCGGLLSPTKGILRKSRVPLSYVPQEPHLFNGTLAENITLVFAADSYSAEEQAKIRQALEKVQLLAWAEQLPQGMMTLLGEGGQNLSQGQRKRLGLARA
ncbi:MAG: ATP-binding cassette domain-containing protein, partial [Anaerovibrio sp.]|nr:ATP-binding cassette domain-containing protein [Anaerovibrio sp.]